MRLKPCFHSLTIAVFVVLSSAMAHAQVGELRGQVFLQTADGRKMPLAGAQIDIFRVDMTGKYAAKTDSKGEFVMALPFIGRYIVAASHPNAAPAWANSRAGTGVPLELILKPGNGKLLTLDEIKNASGGTASESDEQARKNATIEASNQKIVQANETISRTFKAGNEALTSANAASKAGDPTRAIALFTDAISQYDEGLAADTEQPAILTNKAVALKARGVERFNLSVRSTTSDAEKRTGLESAKNDFRAAAEVSTKAVELIKSQRPPNESAELQRYNGNKYAAFLTRAESMRLFVTKVEQSQADTGALAYKDYIAIEHDPVKKSKAHLDMAQMLLDAGSAENALAEFRLILGTQPNSLEANLGAGMALFDTGDKSKYQQAAIYLQRFVELAPDSNPMKADVTAILQELKSEQNIKLKTPSPPRPHP